MSFGAIFVVPRPLFDPPLASGPLKREDLGPLGVHIQTCTIQAKFRGPEPHYVRCTIQLRAILARQGLEFSGLQSFGGKKRSKIKSSTAKIREKPGFELPEISRREQ